MSFTKFNLSVLDRQLGVDVRVSTYLPTEALDAIKAVVYEVAKFRATPTMLAARLAREVLDVSREWGYAERVELSNQMAYDGFAVTIDLNNQRLCINDNGGLDPVGRDASHGSDGGTFYVLFVMLARWRGL